MTEDDILEAFDLESLPKKLKQQIKDYTLFNQPFRGVCFNKGIPGVIETEESVKIIRRGVEVGKKSGQEVLFESSR